MRKSKRIYKEMLSKQREYQRLLTLAESNPFFKHTPDYAYTLGLHTGVSVALVILRKNGVCRD